MALYAFNNVLIITLHQRHDLTTTRSFIFGQSYSPTGIVVYTIVQYKHKSLIFL